MSTAETRVSVEIAGSEISFETGKMAKQASGAVVVRQGDTMVLVTACHSANPREGIDFFPLQVEYRERTSAAGKFPGGFMKREGRPTTKEILTARLSDRPLRPLSPEGAAAIIAERRYDNIDVTKVDPLLPEPFVDTNARHAFVETVRRFDPGSQRTVETSPGFTSTHSTVRA